MNGAFDGGLDAVAEDLGREGVWSLAEENATGTIEGQGMGVVEIGSEVGFRHFAR